MESIYEQSEFKLVQKTISRLPKEAEARDFSHESIHEATESKENGE